MRPQSAQNGSSRRSDRSFLIQQTPFFALEAMRVMVTKLRHVNAQLS
jgi:hypothetical protein